MGKGAAAGIVIALIAGVAIGYFVIPMLFPVAADDGRQRDFCVQNNTAIDMASGAITTIPNLNITFTTETGDSVLFTYTCTLTTWSNTPHSEPFESIYFRYVVDGVIDYASEIYIGDYYNSSVYATHESVTFRYLLTPSAGPHNVSIEVDPSIAAARTLDLNVLCVQIL